MDMDWSRLWTTLGIIFGVALLLAIALILYILYRVRRVNLPPDASFFEALRATPFVVVLALDLLDLGLDFLSAPFAWAILSRLGLQPLRAITVIESIIPGTQALPTMTIAWIVARLWKNPPRFPPVS
jgi:hypothetical protein